MANQRDTQQPPRQSAGQEAQGDLTDLDAMQRESYIWRRGTDTRSEELADRYEGDASEPQSEFRPTRAGSKSPAASTIRVRREPDRHASARCGSPARARAPTEEVGDGEAEADSLGPDDEGIGSSARETEPLGPDDEGIGSVRPEETEPLGPDDEGIGSVRPEETEPLGPDDEGIGSVRPEETEPLGPDDEGIGSVRPEETEPLGPTTKASAASDPRRPTVDSELPRRTRLSVLSEIWTVGQGTWCSTVWHRGTRTSRTTVRRRGVSARPWRWAFATVAQGRTINSRPGVVLGLFQRSSGVGDNLDLGFPHRPNEDGEEELGEPIRAPRPARRQPASRHSRSARG